MLPTQAEMDATSERGLTRLYAHNGPARASFAMQYEPRSGSVLLSFSFANKPDIYSKREACRRLDVQFDSFMRTAVSIGIVPLVADIPTTVFVGFYDGVRTKNDIFGPLLDEFHELNAHRNVDMTRARMHGYAAALIANANQALGREISREKKRAASAAR
jgi:hypothetical protein